MQHINCNRRLAQKGIKLAVLAAGFCCLFELAGEFGHVSSNAQTMRPNKVGTAGGGGGGACNGVIDLSTGCVIVGYGMGYR